MTRLKLHDSAFLYFVTTTINKHLPLFKYPSYRNVVINSLIFCIHNKGLRLFSYVIMPSHLHLITFDSEFNNERLHQTLDHFRSFTAHQIIKELINSHSQSFLKSLSTEKEINRNYRVWTSGYHPVGLTSEDFLNQKFAYIHNNPVNSGLVSDPVLFPFSSASYWETGEKGVLPIHHYLDAEIE